MLALSAGLLCHSCKEKPSPVDYADPTIGGVSVLLETTRQTIHLPNEMLRFMPLRSSMLDDWIGDFSLQMVNHRTLWAYAFMPFCTPTPEENWGKPGVCNNEETHPHYYHAQLDGVDLEFTPSRHSGIMRLTYQGEGLRTIRLRTRTKTGGFSLANRVLTGTAETGNLTVYLYAEFDADMTDIHQLNNEQQLMLTSGEASAGRQLHMRYGLSYISTEQARANLEREIPDFDFDRTRRQAEEAWNARLGQIEVKGGSDDQRRTFYTALYRCSERMVNIDEYGRHYSAYDHQVHESERPFYVDNWIWDTYIALEPLHILLNPEMEVDKINSYIAMYAQSGTMPSFALTTGEWAAMTGNFAAVWMADAWAKGLRFDLEKAYEGLRKNSLDATLLPWANGPRTELDDFYNENGYFPALQPDEEETVPQVDTRWERRQAVSITTANSYSDWAIAKMARILGRQDDEKLFLQRAAFYRNVYRPDRGFMWPKDSRGEWVEPMDPHTAGRQYYTENNAYIFNWDVKHDFDGLFALMGGPAAAEQKLDQLFHEGPGTAKFNFYHVLPDATGLMGQFQMGNEPCFHIPYIYNYVGAPWKAQKYLHALIDAYFPATYLGMPGDEDGGGMSSFVVFTMMGFFPVTPGTTTYALGSPFFDSVTLHLPDGKTFNLRAHNLSPQNKFIQSATLNGKPYTRTWITHEDITAGGTLEFNMGPKPNKAWGADEKDRPKSNINNL